MGFPSPQFGAPLSPDQINLELPFYPAYGVTPSNKYVPIQVTESGELVVEATFSGSITIGEVSITDTNGNTLNSTSGSLDVSVSNFPSNQSVTVVPSSTGVNLFSTNSIPSGIETILLTYTTTFPFHISQLIGWGTVDAEFLIYKNGTMVGGGRSSPSNRTLNVDYEVAPISSNTGDIITITVSQFFGMAQIFRVNLLGE